MTPWDALLAVCGYLRAGFLGAEPPRHDQDISWQLVIEASSNHSVAPALAWCLQDRPDVPAEVRAFFDAVLDLNAIRNASLLASLTRIVAACNAIGVEPVPLKGAVQLVEHNYPAASLRYLSDLDVLVPQDRAADAFAALEKIGFRTNLDDEPIPPAHHHLPVLHDREATGGVELHTHILKSQSAQIIETTWFWAGTRPSVFQGLRIRLPDPTRNVGHIITHDQLHHRSYWGRVVELRQLLDVSMIRSRHEAAIDWAELDHRFCLIGFGEILATYLAIAETLLGQPAPRLSCPPRRNAVEEFRRIVDPMILDS